MLYEALNRQNSQYLVKNGLVIKKLAYVGIRILVKRHIRPELFVLNVAVPTLMYMKRCMASMASPAYYSFDFFM